jgi:hypothetical protein
VIYDSFDVPPNAIIVTMKISDDSINVSSSYKVEKKSKLKLAQSISAAVKYFINKMGDLGISLGKCSFIYK